ncbi:MAG: alpha/beta hydrolase [Phycisphaeraceae bacterium]|nr:MAG: alpha/beta hydrolase [Phycisphaeraceae bacterium]
MSGFITIMLTGLLIAVAAATGFTVRRLRRPPKRTYGAAVARGLPGDPGELPTPRTFETWMLRVDSPRTRSLRGLEMPVWDIPGDDPNGPTIMLTPGWGDSRIGALARIPHLAPMSARLLAWDPPGHGEAPGECALGTSAEVEALAALAQRAIEPGKDAGRLALYGWSLGAGVSIATAAAWEGPGPAPAVIAEAPYRVPMTPARRVMRAAGYPYRINVPLTFAYLGIRLGVGPKWRGFDRAELAALMRSPLLVLHGARDTVSPVEDGRAIAAAAKDGAICEITDAGHNDLWTDPQYAERCIEAVDAFLERSFRTRG